MQHAILGGVTSLGAQGTESGLKTGGSVTPQLQPPRYRNATPIKQAAPMPSTRQRSNATALVEQGVTMKSMTARQNLADFLEVLPALSSCTRNVLEEFVRNGVVTVHFAAGQAICAQTAEDHNLYVLTSGSALFDVGDDVVISLTAGDYFGKSPSHGHPLAGSVIADSDVELLVINPLDVARLGEASCRERHPSMIDWRVTLRTTTRRASRRSHRRAVLASQGV